MIHTDYLRLYVYSLTMQTDYLRLYAYHITMKTDYPTMQTDYLRLHVYHFAKQTDYPRLYVYNLTMKTDYLRLYVYHLKFHAKRDLSQFPAIFMRDRKVPLIGQAAHGRWAGIILLTAWPIRGTFLSLIKMAGN